MQQPGQAAVAVHRLQIGPKKVDRTPKKITSPGWAAVVAHRLENSSKVEPDQSNPVPPSQYSDEDESAQVSRNLSPTPAEEAHAESPESTEQLPGVKYAAPSNRYVTPTIKGLLDKEMLERARMIAEFPVPSLHALWGRFRGLHAKRNKEKAKKKKKASPKVAAKKASSDDDSSDDDSSSGDDSSREEEKAKKKKKASPKLPNAGGERELRRDQGLAELTITGADVLEQHEFINHPLREMLGRALNIKPDQQLDFFGFVDVMSVFNVMGPIDPKMKLIFKLFHTDADSTQDSLTQDITRDEVCSTLRKLTGRQLSDEDLDTLVNHVFMIVDENLDDGISYDEFVKLVGKTDIASAISLNLPSS